LILIASEKTRFSKWERSGKDGAYIQAIDNLVTFKKGAFFQGTGGGGGGQREDQILWKVLLKEGKKVDDRQKTIKKKNSKMIGVLRKLWHINE